MATVFISSIFGGGGQFLNAQGVPLNGGRLYAYLAGTLTPATTYTDATGLVQNGNPYISLGSDGRLQTEIWAAAGTKLKFILLDVNGASIGAPTLDNVPLVNDISTATANSLWNASGVVPSFVNSTQFSAANDQTLVFPVGSRVKYAVTAGTFYATVGAVSYTPTTTTVTIVPDSTGLDNGLSAVLISPITVVGSPADANDIVYKPNVTPVPGSVAAALQTTGRYTVTAGTPTALTLAPLVPPTAYVAGQTYLVQFNQASGASPTLNISSLGARNLTQYSTAGTIIPAVVYANQVSLVAFDGTQFVVLESIQPAAVASPTSKLLRITTLTASGTWTKGTGTTYVVVEVTGGGGGSFVGGSNGGGGGGGSGGYSRKFVSTPGATEVVTVGTGGAPTASIGAPGSAGNASSFGAWCVANGGGGGTSAVGGGGGAPGTGDVALQGGVGGGPNPNLSTDLIFGQGGNGFFGGGAPASLNVGSGINGTVNTGGGGSGGTTIGGSGGSGLVIVHEYS